MTTHVRDSVFLAYQVFRELANHEMKLATSLQALVPTNKDHLSTSAQYLQEDAAMLKDLSERVKELIKA